MPEATPSSWMLDVVFFVGAFSAMTYGFMFLLKPRTVRPPEPGDEE